MILISATLGFLTVLLGVPIAEKYLAASGIYGRDQQKHGKPAIPTSGGVIVLIGFLLAITFYTGAMALFTDVLLNREIIFASLSSVTLIALIGLIDDIHVDLNRLVREDIEKDIVVDIETGKTVIHQKAELVFGNSTKHQDRKGLSQAVKMLMVLPAAFPLIAVGAGSWSMYIPLIGYIHWGLMYPLVLLPLGLLFVSNVVNMLAGTNGLAASLSLIASTTLGVFTYQNGSLEASAIAFCLSACLLPFVYYNWHPASILPGDSLTYLAGATMFSVIVIGNIEVFAVALFLPWMIEFFLKLRSKFQAHSWGELDSQGNLNSLYTKNYSLTHLFMDRGLNESQITLAISSAVTIWAITVLIMFNYLPFLTG